MEIREIRQHDFEGFKRLMGQFYAFSGETLWDEEKLKELLDPAVNLLFLGAFQQDRLVGLLSLTFGHSSYKTAPFAWCDDLIVDPDYRRQGVAKGLMQKAAEEARSRQCSNILLGVGKDETRARDFYASVGYKDMNCRLMTYPLI